MQKQCAEFRNEPQSVTMQQNLRHIWVGDMTHYRPPSDIFLEGGDSPYHPRDLRHCSCQYLLKFSHIFHHTHARTHTHTHTHTHTQTLDQKRIPTFAVWTTQERQL